MKCVLLVDDDQDIREALAELFEDSYRVLVAPNGLVALEILSRQRVDAVVLDLMMPLMDGATLLKELNDRRQRVPVVLLSAARDLPERAGALGAKGYCSKPCSPEEILAAVARVIDEPPGGNEQSSGEEPPDAPSTPRAFHSGGKIVRRRGRARQRACLTGVASALA
jgi:DNA-binding response OmpR family regulator